MTLFMKMIRLHIYITILIVIFLNHFGYSQVRSLGVPFIVNHSRSTYNASTQNWSVTQNSKGFLYFGNNDGILEYDGTNWRIFPVPNASVVRSLLAVGDTIYAGAFEEIGYMATSSNGQLHYHSLKDLIPGEYLNFDEIWNIFQANGDIVFQSFKYIFTYNGHEMKVTKPLSSFGMMYFVGGRHFVLDNETGLMIFQNDTLELLSDHPVFFRNEIRCILPYSGDTILVGTSNEGLFLFDGINLLPWNVEVNTMLRNDNIFSAIMLSDGNYVFGTVRNGVYISNRQGIIQQHLNRFKGLQNNTVLDVFEDRKNNLWLGLDNGIDYIEISSPVTSINYNFNIESAYASIVHNGMMYIGTNQGLYAAQYDKIRNSGANEEKFRLIRGTEGQIWTLEVIDNTLFCGHNFGCFIIDGFTALQISDIRGFWSFLKPANQENIIICGTYTGLVRLTRSAGQWRFLDELEGFNESSRDKKADRFNNLWISHGYRGLFNVRLNPDYNQITNVDFFRAGSGLPEALPYNVQLINDEIYITTHDGIYLFDYAGYTFFKPEDINRMFGNKGFLDRIYQDMEGNLWYFTTQSMGVMRLLEDGTYRDITAPFSGINDNLIPAFNSIYVYDPNNVFIGSQKGLMHYNPSLIRDYSQIENVYIREASFYGKKDSKTIHNVGNFNDNKPVNISSLPFSINSVVFRFTIPAFENPGKLRFSSRLIGFNDNWSDWDGINFKEYTNLREGKYTFEVKALNAFNAESQVSSFTFVIEPPFIRSPVAYGIYTVIFLVFIAANIYFIRRRMLKIRLREKTRHEKRLAQREKIFQEKSELSEKEIINLRNESLRNEMVFKNKELANTTLHLIQKNRTLTSLKNDLSKLIKNAPSGSTESQLANNLIKKINKDLRNEKNWELFNNYFDEVHQDFINRLKEKYLDLTPKELRLCAYLRMNISSKEIAPLMNISVRGVEISRYRLRKKLQLDHDTNLAEFILTF
jgi:DNA-binding CsgD family transcriptional regulator